MTVIILSGSFTAKASGWTHQMPDGNRTVQGSGLDLSTVQPMDVPLSGTPIWIVSSTFQNGILWVAVLTDGSIEAFKVANGAFSGVTLNVSKLPPGMPPLLYQFGSQWHVWSPPKDASPWTHGIILEGSNGSAYIDKQGDLVFDHGKQLIRIPVNALPDARLLKDEHERIILLTQPTDQYAHGVLGDRLEAKSITLLETFPEPRIVKTIHVGASEVIEGIMPIWVDVDGDGVREIIVTISEPGQGASLRVYKETGEIMAESSAIGRSNRWRNQAAVFEADDSGKLYLTDVLTPHIGGTLEFFEWKADRLELASSLSRFTSHQIGSRNLDLALVGPFGTEGKQCVVLPNPSRGTLTAVGLIENQATILWTQRLDGILSSNLSGAQTPTGTVALGLGTSNGKFQIWQADDPTPYLSIESVASESPNLNLTVMGSRETTYTLQTSNDFDEWHPIGEIQPTETKTKLVFPTSSTESQAFFRAQETQDLIFADIDSVEFSGNENAYSFQVTVSSPDTGCEKYADWWEVLTDKGELLYRRVLLHSHVNEQPFRRSGGIVNASRDQRLIIRAHMSNNGYGGKAMIGTIEIGFEHCFLPHGFGNELASVEPLPRDCAF